MANRIRQKLRTLSKTGFFVVVLLFVFTAFVSIAIAQLFSPGKLGNAHVHLEGLKNCKKCHSSNREIDAKLCLCEFGKVACRLTNQLGMVIRAGRLKVGQHLCRGHKDVLSVGWIT